MTHLSLEAKESIVTKALSQPDSKRGHSSLNRTTPTKKAEEKSMGAISINNYRWKKHALGLFDVPIAA